MSCAEAERRTTCVLWQQDARTTAERSFEGSCQKAGNPLRAAKKTEANYVCLMRKGSKLLSPSPSLSLFVVWGVKLICRCTMWATQCCGKYLYLYLCLCLACLMWREFNILTSGAGYQICLLLLHITHNWMGKVIAGDCISGTTWRIINIPLSSFASTNWSKNDHNNHYYYRWPKPKPKHLKLTRVCVWSQVGEVEGSFPLIRNWWLPISLSKQSNLRTLKGILCLLGNCFIALVIVRLFIHGICALKVCYVTFLYNISLENIVKIIKSEFNWEFYYNMYSSLG